MVKTELFYLPANNKCFSSGGGWGCAWIVISGLLINKVAVKQHLISIFKLANLNKLEPRHIGREDLWPALEFLVLGIPGEFQANASAQLIQ